MRGLPALSQINLEHARITLYLLHRALAQVRTLVEHRHLGAELADELHVVLDDEDGAVARDAEEQIGGARGLFVRHARHRLVDEEELGILRHHHPDLQPLLLAVRQRARQHAALAARPTCSSAPSMRRRSSSTSPRSKRVAKTPLLARRRDSSTFSRTVRFTNTDGVWNFRPTPSAAISFSRSCVRSVWWPKITRPLAGRTRPEITSSSVVLPAPLGPMTTRSSRRSM